MALVSRRWFDEEDRALRRHRDSFWERDDWLDDWADWPRDWPKPRDLMERFNRDSSRFSRDWPSDWPRFDAIMPRFTSELDRMDRNWRDDPFWRDLYPRWAEPIFKEGIDVHSNIVNDRNRFAVDIDCYQFRPEEVQVKMLDDTLMIEGRHEEVKDRENFTKMYFVRKYQLPSDVDGSAIQSSIDSRGRLTVEAPKRANALGGRERMVPIEGPSKGRSSSASPRTRHDSGFSNGYSPRGPESPMHVDTSSMSGRGREVHIDTSSSINGRHEVPINRSGPASGPYLGREVNIERNSDFASRRDREIREREERPYRQEVPIRDERGRAFGDFNDDRSNSNYTHSRSYFHRSESRTSNTLSPHQTTMDNERNAYSPRRSSFDDRAFGTDREQTSPGRGVFDKIRDKFEKGFRSQSRNSSRQDYRDNGYRVDSPASNYSRREFDNAGRGGEEHAESVRSIRIERKTHNY